MLLILFHLFSWLEVIGVLFCDKLLRFIFLLYSLFSICIFSVCNYFVIKWIQNSSYLNMGGNFWRNKGAFMDFPGSSVGKEAACSAETWIRSLGLEDPLEKQMETHSSILAWKILWKGDLGEL